MRAHAKAAQGTLKRPSIGFAVFQVDLLDLKRFHRFMCLYQAGLREELIAFGVLLRRAALLAPEDMKEVSQKMLAYDPFIMEDPHFGALIRVAAAKEAQILAEAKAKALLLASLKQTLLHLVEDRFPALASSTIALPDDSQALEQLMRKIATAPSEDIARSLLKLAVQE